LGKREAGEAVGGTGRVCFEIAATDGGGPLKGGMGVVGIFRVLLWIKIDFLIA